MIAKDIAKADRNLFLIRNVSYLICNDREKLRCLNFTQNVRMYAVANYANQFVLNCFSGVLSILWSTLKVVAENNIVFCSKAN